MPLGKYYCDYCDKEFQDTPSARQRHLQGPQHQRAKALWYNSFKDQNQAYTESFGKGVCNRFVRTGVCRYGNSCKYFHPKQNLQNSISQGATGSVVRDSTGLSWGNLPPSLKPPPEGGYPSLTFVDWG